MALIAMTADHVAVYLFPLTPISLGVSSTVGRVAFPLFAAMMAWHAVHHTRHLGRYIGRVLLLGAVAQIAYMSFPRYPVYAYLNVCFTLAFGLGIYAWYVSLVERYREGWVRVICVTFEIYLLALALLIVAPLVEFGALGVLLVPCMIFAFQAAREEKIRGIVWGGVLVAFAGILNVGVGVISACVSALTVYACWWGIRNEVSSPAAALPTLPRFLWRAWYPGHFVLLLLAVWYQA